jgi:dTDP-4-dehydrorhamnose 3,5-epimerase
MEATKILDGPVLFWPKKYTDSRGSFHEMFNEDRYAQWISGIHWAQVNHSRTVQSAIRGLHYREGEAKLITVMHGEIHDVVVNIVPESELFGQWFGFQLKAGAQIFVPAGFAHGFAVKSADAEIVYLTNKTYDPKLSRGLAWDDPDLKIPWGIQDPTISDQDKKNPSWKEYKEQHVK